MLTVPAVGMFDFYVLKYTWKDVPVLQQLVAVKGRKAPTSLDVLVEVGLVSTLLPVPSFAIFLLLPPWDTCSSFRSVFFFGGIWVTTVFSSLLFGLSGFGTTVSSQCKFYVLDYPPGSLSSDGTSSVFSRI